MSDPHNKPRRNKGMEINLDRPHRVRTTVAYWIVLLSVGCLLAWMLMRFTGSKLVAIGLAGGMLLYMVIASAITSRHLSQQPGDGRLD